MAVFAGKQTFKRQSCVGPIKFVGARISTRISPICERLRPNAARGSVHECGVTGRGFAFQPNRFYPTHVAYVEAIAEAMQPEYEAIVNAGLVLQLDCPDLAMGPPHRIPGSDEAEFLKRAGTSG